MMIRRASKGRACYLSGFSSILHVLAKINIMIRGHLCYSAYL
jgi:hypothetical protein